MRFISWQQLLAFFLVPMSLELAETFGVLDTPFWVTVHNIATGVLVVAIVVFLLQRLRLLPAVRA